jgi:hypothetical protein
MIDFRGEKSDAETRAALAAPKKACCSSEKAFPAPANADAAAAGLSGAARKALGVWRMRAAENRYPVPANR